MLALLALVHISVYTLIDGRVLIYNTENEEAVQEFDCVYNLLNYGESITYCRRPYSIEFLDRSRKTCENRGEKLSFRTLLQEEVHPSTVLNWSSSIEVADLYASIFYNQSLLDDYDNQSMCKCIIMGTFGKYCEYKLIHDRKFFSETITDQFQQKESDKNRADLWNTQRYGKIICYNTLPCPSSPLCLDWREICDGIQRCSDGIDEENCDKLEFNECEDNEYRCTNGMCIPEEFWLDGEYDCMDWSDEFYVNNEDACPFESNPMICDEHLCASEMYSCGDGECVRWYTRMAFQRMLKATPDCFSKRNLNYMCEFSFHQPAWTLESGLCWPDKDYDDHRYPPWSMINSSNLDNDVLCNYLFRCALSKGFERDCPCDHRNCSYMMKSICSKSNPLIDYPPQGLINSNYIIRYNFTQPMNIPTFQNLHILGTIKCRGYLFQTENFIMAETDLNLLKAIIMLPFLNRFLCAESKLPGNRNISSPYKSNQFCWNDSLTFNGRPYAVVPEMCKSTSECISQYRINNGLSDCMSNEDEGVRHKQSYCTGNVGRQRFQCFNDQHKCLPINFIGLGKIYCSNRYDKSWFGNGIDLRHQFHCNRRIKTGCPLAKTYIQQSSLVNFSNDSWLLDSQRQNPTNRIPFRHYCDSFWDLSKHVDEKSTSCHHWICQSDQYQCRTGQCIKLDWVCDGEWDCSDASDEEAIALNVERSAHNSNLLDLLPRLEKCRELYYKAPFSSICNTSFEVGCYLSKVQNPLNIQLNRPCINLTQIGDGVEDCYNAYDEKNTFATSWNIEIMWGFYFSCGHDNVAYMFACDLRPNCSPIFCSRHRDRDGSCSEGDDFICIDNDQCKKHARCNGKVDCSNGEDEYWCPSETLQNHIGYRHEKQGTREMDDISLVLIRQYPPENKLNASLDQSPKFTINLQNDEFLKIQSYKCNRGIAVIQRNVTRCLCPPAFFGEWCEFFSDRISIIAQINRTGQLENISNRTLKIKVNFFVHNELIDHHEFHVAPISERYQLIKHKFYLLYSRSSEMLEHKKKRYFNRSDIINNHPYSVHFDVFSLTPDERAEEIGSWRYPVYLDYLPAFRLAVVLTFPPWLENATRDLCSKDSCQVNSVCLPIFNQNSSFYCSCKSGYYGANCGMFESLCSTYCSAQALCRIDNANIKSKKSKPFCVCPLGHFGTRCNLKYDQCSLNSCLNNGTCLANYDPSGENPYVCKCSQWFYGSRCEVNKATVHVSLNIPKTLVARAAVVQLYSILDPQMMLFNKYQRVYNDLPRSINYYHPDSHAPMVGILKIYEDLAKSQYLLIYFLSNQQKINITSSPYHCPHVSSLLFEDSDPSIALVFKYHHLCKNNSQRVCFYDRTYFCVCQQNQYRAECFINDVEYDHCDKCLSGGRCVQGDLENLNDFVCICPSCHQGHRCEFSLQAFGFTLDSLLVNYPKEVKVIYVSVISLLFMIGLVNNICSFVTFKRPIPRKVSVGNYLLILSCLNQTALFCLVFKFIQITFEITNFGSCRVIAYFLSVMVRSTYWLTSWITIDRLFMILYPTSSYLKKPRLAVGISFITVFMLIGMHAHEMIYYTAIQHVATGVSICVTNFDRSFISSYNRVSTLIHYFVPFIIQFFCITALIILAARSRMKTTGQKISFGNVLKRQFKTQKELYMTPIIIILSALPQAIITFSFACIQLNNLQRHVLLNSYVLSFTPQILGFVLHVLPSTSYRKEFNATYIGKFSFTEIIGKNDETVVPKTKSHAK